jgi:simple sugar transport system ATP-binding protein
MLNITKEFPGIKANDDVTLQLKKGEVHALLGENGAGKSTLMSILFGLYQPTSGKIMVKGEEVFVKDPNHANRLGIGMVHQHFKLVHNFTVAENIILGIEEVENGKLVMENAIKRITELSERYNLKVDPNAKIEDISVGMQQRVEILKMLYRNAEILIFDEPTAVLTPQEIEELMKVIRELVAEGKSVIIITHKLDEIKFVADRCSVLRKGQYIGTVEVAPTSKEELAEMMVGRKVSFEIDKKDAEPTDEVLVVEGLTLKSRLHDKDVLKEIALNVRKGEIVCIAGIEGNGQTELVEVITGLKHADRGTVKFEGQEITQMSIRNRSQIGIGHIPEDRHKHGLVLDYSLEDNLILQSYFKEPFSKNGILNRKETAPYADRLIEQFDVRSGKGRDTSVRSMSGGNQQKAIIAREVDRNPDLLIAVQPTRGLDVGAIEYIHDQLIAHRDKNKAVLLISLELDEVLNVSDRIYVMFEGEIVGEVLTKETTANELGLYMSGSKRGES